MESQARSSGNEPLANQHDPEGYIVPVKPRKRSSPEINNVSKDFQEPFNGSREPTLSNHLVPVPDATVQLANNTVIARGECTVAPVPGSSAATTELPLPAGSNYTQVDEAGAFPSTSGPPNQRPEVSSHDGVPYLPFGEANGVEIHTLYDLLRVSCPPAPPPYDPKKMQSTKNITEHALKIKGGDRLKKIVVVPDLLSQFYKEASEELKAVGIDWLNEDHRKTTYKIHPCETTKRLTPVYKSEVDVGTWSTNAHFLPVLEALDVVRNGTMSPVKPIPKTPFVSSSPHGITMTDFALMDGPDENHSRCHLALELKTSNAADDHGRHIFAKIVEASSQVPHGTAIKFKWPENLLGCNPQTRVLVQSWMQLLHYKCNMGALSTFGELYFYARGSGTSKDTLFLSPPVLHDEAPLFALFCWFSCALGRLKTRLVLPEPDTRWWGTQLKSGQIDSPGVVVPTLYKNYPKDTLKTTPQNDAGPASTGPTEVPPNSSNNAHTMKMRLRTNRFLLTAPYQSYDSEDTYSDVITSAPNSAVTDTLPGPSSRNGEALSASKNTSATRRKAPVRGGRASKRTSMAVINEESSEPEPESEPALAHQRTTRSNTSRGKAAIRGGAASSNRVAVATIDEKSPEPEPVRLTKVNTARGKAPTGRGTAASRRTAIASIEEDSPELELPARSTNPSPARASPEPKPAPRRSTRLGSARGNTPARGGGIATVASNSPAAAAISHDSSERDPPRSTTTRSQEKAPVRGGGGAASQRTGKAVIDEDDSEHGPAAIKAAPSVEKTPPVRASKSTGVTVTNKAGSGREPARSTNTDSCRAAPVHGGASKGVAGGVIVDIGSPAQEAGPSTSPGPSQGRAPPVRGRGASKHIGTIAPDGNSPERNSVRSTRTGSSRGKGRR